MIVIIEGTFGSRLRSAREAKNLTQKDLADLVGKDEAVISKWERGKNRPQKANITLLAESLEISTHWLTTGKASSSADDMHLSAQAEVSTSANGNLLTIPFYTPAWELADQFSRTGGLSFTDEAHAKIAILAASLAIQAGREPNREDVLAAISLSLSK